MKQFLFSFLLLFTGILSAQSSLHVMSFNIRYPNPGDGLSYWENRKDRVAQTILYHEADIIGVQEAFRSQLDFLHEALNGEFEWFGVCRTDGSVNPDPENEFSAVIYNKNKFERLDGGTFWLSETPEIVGSVGWDAALPRIVTWAKFKSLTDQKEFFFFNTHFDHVGKTARTNSAALLRKKIDEIASNHPVVCMGDFNSNPETEAYQVMTSESHQINLKDALHLSALDHFGPMGSLTKGFTLPVVPNSRIDYIFVSDEFEVEKHAILAESVDGRTASDHLAVLSRIRLK